MIVQCYTTYKRNLLERCVTCQSQTSTQMQTRKNVNSTVIKDISQFLLLIPVLLTIIAFYNVGLARS